MSNAQSQRLLFVGDSVTEGQGDGYVQRIADRIRDAVILNAGVGGNRVRDLRVRWRGDVIEHRPTMLTTMIGVNDTWRRYDSGDPTSVEAFRDDYVAILDSASAAGISAHILMEPFIVPINQEQERWRTEDLADKIAVVHELAGRANTVLVPLDQILNDIARDGDPRDIATDGIHPTALGHTLIADCWMDVYQRLNVE